MSHDPTANVLCVGILVADVVVPPIPRLPRAGELIATDDFLVQPGGCAANTAISLRRLGVRSTVVGRVGDDVFGGLVEDYLRDRGVDTSGVLRTEKSGTSKTVILPVAGDDRRFVHTFGANAALTAEDIPRALLERADVIYVGGYLVLPGLHPGALAERLRVARSHGASIVLDVVVPSDRAALSIEAVAELLPLADYFVPNEDEARALTGESELRRQAASLRDAGSRVAVIKRGERGAFVQADDETFELPAPPVQVVEPSGAGDAFAAGLAYAVVEGWELERSVRFASVMGASACRALGCYAGVFTREEAERFLAAHPEWAGEGSANRRTRS